MAFFKTSPAKNNLIEFAEYVIANFGGGAGTLNQNKKWAKLCEDLISEHRTVERAPFSERIYLLKYAGDMIETLDAYALHLKSTCYVYAGATGRAKAIDALEAYIALGHFLNRSGTILRFDERISYNYLAEAYSGEYRFSEAIQTYTKYLKLFPADILVIFKIADNYRKSNDLDSAIALLNSYKSHPAYKGNKKILGQLFTNEDFGFQTELDTTLDDLQKKRQRGYKYRPRPSK